MKLWILDLLVVWISGLCHGHVPLRARANRQGARAAEQHGCPWHNVACTMCSTVH